MSDVKLGEIIITPQRRDAIHIAVAPVVAGEQLTPGVRVGLLEDGRVIFARGNAPSIGIVDPFLRNAVEEGQRFWLVLHPGTVTGLRHEWTHPAFDGSDDEQWLKNFAESSGISYSTLMSGAETWLAYEDYLNYGPLLEGQYVPDEFWVHYERVTGKSVPAGKRQNFFTCSC